MMRWDKTAHVHNRIIYRSGMKVRHQAAGSNKSITGETPPDMKVGNCRLRRERVFFGPSVGCIRGIDASATHIVAHAGSRERLSLTDGRRRLYMLTLPGVALATKRIRRQE